MKASSMSLSNNHLFILFILFIFLPIPDVVASSEFWNSKNIRFKKFSYNHELSQPSVEIIEEGQHGEIWLGTQHGLNKFDGQHIKVFKPVAGDPDSISGLKINSLLTDSEGNLWIGSDDGLHLHQKQHQAFANYKSMQVTDSDTFKKVSSFSVVDIKQAADGTLWLLTRRLGVFSFTPTVGNIGNQRIITRHYHVDADTFMKMALGPDNSLWIATRQKGLFRLDTTTGATKNFNSDNNPELRSNYMSFLLADEQGIWVGQNNALLKIGYAGEVQIKLEFADHFSSCRGKVSDIEIIGKDLLLFATSHGVCAYSISLGTLVNLSDFPLIADPLERFDNNNIISMKMDSSGILWVGTTNGIYQWRSSTPVFEKFNLDTIKDGLYGLKSEVITSFTEINDGELLIGTWDGGLSLLDLNTSAIRAPMLNLFKKTSHIEKIMSLFADQHSVWIGTYNDGIYQYDLTSGVLKQFTKEKNLLSSNSITRIQPFTEGLLLIGTYGGGTSILDTNTNEVVQLSRLVATPYDEKRLKVSDYLHLGDGKVLILTFEQGIFLYDHTHQRISSFNIENSPLTTNEFFTATVFEDSILLGTHDKGIQSISKAELLTSGLIKFTGPNQLNNRLPSKTVYGLIVDKYSRVWVSHTNGLSMLNYHQNYSQNFSKENNLQGLDFNTGAFYQSRKEGILFGGSNGFNLIPEALLPSNKKESHIVLTEVKINNSSVFSDMALQSDASYQLTVEQGSHIDLHFSLLNFVQPQANTYQFKVLEKDANWQNLEHKNTLQLNNLPLGKTTVLIRGINSDGNYSRSHLHIKIKTTLSFQTLLLYGQTILTLCLLLLTFSYHRTLKNRSVNVSKAN